MREPPWRRNGPPPNGPGGPPGGPPNMNNRNNQFNPQNPPRPGGPGGNFGAPGYVQPPPPPGPGGPPGAPGNANPNRPPFNPQFANSFPGGFPPNQGMPNGFQMNANNGPPNAAGKSSFASLLEKSAAKTGVDLVHLFDGEWSNKKNQTIVLNGIKVNDQPIFSVVSETRVQMMMGGVKYTGDVQNNGTFILWSDADEWRRIKPIVPVKPAIPQQQQNSHVDSSPMDIDPEPAKEDEIPNNDSDPPIEFEDEKLDKKKKKAGKKKKQR